MFYLILYLHIKACFFYFIIRQSKVWSAGADSIYYDADNEPMQLRVFNDDLTTTMERYLIMLYNSLLFMTVNEVGARTISEVLTGIIMLVLDTFVAGNIFGKQMLLSV